MTAGDFIVSLGKQKSPVRVLDFLEFGAAAPVEAIASTREATNQAGAAAVRANRGGRIFMIVVDDLSCRPGEGKELLVAAERQLASFSFDDLVGIVSTSSMGPRLMPTRDRARVLSALRSKTLVGRNVDSAAPFYVSAEEAIEIAHRAPAEPFPTVYERECQGPNTAGRSRRGPGGLCAVRLRSASRAYARAITDRTTQQVGVFTEVIRGLAAMPAPRLALTLSCGVAMHHLEGLAEQYEAVSRTAADAQVQFYALTLAPEEFNMHDEFPGRATARRAEGSFLNAGVQAIAQAAGGEAFKVVGQADRFFTRVLSETSGVYRLGVDAPPGSGTHRYLDARVIVDRPGVTVRTHRRAILASARAERPTIDQALRDRIALGGTAFGVPLRAAAALRRDPAGGDRMLQIVLSLEVPKEVAGPLVAMFAVIDTTGKIVLAGQNSVSSDGSDDVRMTLPLTVPAGGYRVRVAVADAYGNVGAVQRDVDVHLPHMGSMSTSELFVSRSGPRDDGSVPVFGDIPENTRSMRVSLELYPDNPQLAVPRVRFSLLRADSDAVIAEHELSATRVSSWFSATASVPVDSLELGAYRIRATVFENGVPLGTVSTLIRKGPQ